MALHCRILWRLLGQNDVPPPVPAHVVDSFNQRFKSGDDVRTSVEQMIHQAEAASAEAVAACQDIRQKAHTGGGTNAKRMQMVDDRFLQLMFNTVARAGLVQWQPDVFGSSDSMYNLLYENIAIITFQAVCAGYAYRTCRVDLASMRDYGLCSRFYRSFVYSYMAGLAKDKLKQSGRTASKNERAAMLKRRNHVSYLWLCCSLLLISIFQLRETRVKQLKDDGFHPQVIRLAQENNAHSEDERKPDSPPNEDHYLIREKVGRSEKVTVLFRQADVWYQEGLNRRTGQQ